MGYYVRPMTKDDIPQVNEIDREAFPTQWPPPNYRHEIENQVARYIVVCDDSRTIESTPPYRRSLLDRLALRLKCLFKTSGDSPPNPTARHPVIGFAGIWLMADESHLTNIAVRSAYQRKGIGELLLISIIELSMALKAEMVTLEVRVSNTSAQRLYLKYGFTQTGLRRAYYTDNREDAMLMSTSRIASPEFQALFQRLKESWEARYGQARSHLATQAQPGRQ